MYVVFSLSTVFQRPQRAVSGQTHHRPPGLSDGNHQQRRLLSAFRCLLEEDGEVRHTVLVERHP